MKGQFGTIDGRPGRQGTMVDKRLAKIRVGLEGLDIFRKIHRVRKYPLKATSPYIISSHFRRATNRKGETVTVSPLCFTPLS